MKRTLRFYFALLFARATALAVKLIGRQGTSMPGSWAIILCPNFLEQMPKPKHVITVTGTNGKTTVANMVADVLEKNGVPFCSNRFGSNVNTGIASTLIASSKFFGQPKYDLAVLEVDERSTPRIFPYLKPDLLLVTNLFRDSCKRNAHAEYIYGILNGNIPPETKLVLNGDDPLSSSLAPENRRVYYGIEALDIDGREAKNIVNDVPVCPVCGGALTHDVVRYHHIGRVHCEACGYHSPERGYLAAEIDPAAKRLTMTVRGEAETYPLVQENAINIYNEVAAIAALRELELSEEQIRSALSTTVVNESRYAEIPVGSRKIIQHLAKGQNPVACSRAFENIRDYPGKKSVILFLDDFFDAKSSSENTSWYYDTDFEFLNDENIVQIVAAGARHHDVHLRALLAGVPPERLVHMREESEVTAAVTEDADAVFVLYDIYTIKLANDTRDALIARFEKEAGHAH